MRRRVSLGSLGLFGMTWKGMQGVIFQDTRRCKSLPGTCIIVVRKDTSTEIFNPYSEYLLQKVYSESVGEPF